MHGVYQDTTAAGGGMLHSLDICHGTFTLQKDAAPGRNLGNGKRAGAALL